jgi:GNAT superfamily N-acetyltransferase
LTCALFPAGGFNGVTRALLHPDEVEARISEVSEHYARRELRFRWTVMPDSLPLDLGTRLKARGLTELQLLGLATSSSTPVGVAASGVRVVAVGRAELAAHDAVVSEGWGAPPGALGDYHRAALADPRRAHRLFLALVDGVPAGVASAMVFERSMYLLGGVVLPRFRRRGVYRELVAARARVAQSLGLPLLTTHAMMDTSAPLLAALGFDTWFRFSAYLG